MTDPINTPTDEQAETVALAAWPCPYDYPERDAYKAGYIAALSTQDSIPADKASADVVEALREAFDVAQDYVDNGDWNGAYQSLRARYLSTLASRSTPAEGRGLLAEKQAEIGRWMLECFGEEIAADRIERGDRFIEEALELAQTVEGFTADRAHALVDYVFGRAVGEKEQEVGGVMVTLAALCNTAGIDIQAAMNTEVARIWTKVDVIRAKQATKPTGSALPIPAEAPSEPPAQDSSAPVDAKLEQVIHSSMSRDFDRLYVPEPSTPAQDSEGLAGALHRALTFLSSAAGAGLVLEGADACDRYTALCIALGVQGDVRDPTLDEVATALRNPPATATFAQGVEAAAKVADRYREEAGGSQSYRQACRHIAQTIRAITPPAQGEPPRADSSKGGE